MSRGYSDYIESGSDWLGRIPAHWKPTPLKHVADFVNGAAFKPDTWSEHGTPIIRIENLNGGTDFNHYEGEIDDRYEVKEGDILFGWSGNRGTSFGPFIWSRPGRYLLNQHIFNVQRYSCDRLWFFWCLKAVTEHVEEQAHGIIGMVHITKGNLGAIRVPISPLPEQRAIAAFLDRETGKIDALVEEQRRLIALLKEKRQAVISHAVTRGLDPTAPMKDSGVEWLGEIPAHWSVMPLKHLTAPGRDIMYGIVLPGPSVEEGVPIVKGGDVKAHRLRVELLNRTTAEIEAPFARARLKPNDIVYSIRGTIGDAELVPPELEDANITQDVARVSPNKYTSHIWLLYALRSRPVFVQLEQRSLGAAVRGINIFDLKRARIPVPPTEEQQAIGAFLEMEMRRIGELIAEAEKAIALLQERRSALISAAVTGKIDVRGAVPDATEAA